MLSVQCKLFMNILKLLLRSHNLVLQLPDNLPTAVDRKLFSDIGLAYDGLHGLKLETRVDSVKYLQDVADPEKLVCILKHFWLVWWEIRS